MKVGNACGFWGDDIRAPRNLLLQQPDLDYLTLDYLAEVSLSIMAVQQEKDPDLGYARDFVEVLKSIIPHLGKCKVITNAGGLNPLGLARICKALAPHLKIGVITGDSVLDQVKIPHLDLVTANAYIGGRPIAIALDLGADIVIAGRVADPSLTVGPCLHHFRWNHDDYDKMAGSTIAGHLIECGTQVTGGISTDWLSINADNMGYPIAEIAEDGSCVITKPDRTGGVVSEQTVKEQLLYEIGDPACYKSPDVNVSFLGLNVKRIGPNRVQVQGALGSPPPFTLKVSATYKAGYKAEGHLAFFGDNALEKAQKTGEIIFSKVQLEKTLIETVGTPLECWLRLSAFDKNKEPLEAFAKEIAPLVTSGPQGTTGYFSGRPEVRKVFGFYPTLINANAIKINIDIL